jgi:TPR repeat protein
LEKLAELRKRTKAGIRKLLAKNRERRMNGEAPVADEHGIDEFHEECRKKSLVCYSKAVAMGSRDAAVAMGNILLGFDVDAAEHWYKRAGTHPAAMVRRARIMAERGDYDGAIAVCQESFAVNSCPHAGFFWGWTLHQLGRTQEENRRFLELISFAASPPHLIEEAMLYLARMYMSGDGVPVDMDKGLKILHNAAVMSKHSSGEAALEFGRYLYHDAKEYQRAMTFFRKAAEQFGSGEAFCEMAAMYYNGNGVPRDRSRAFELYQEASERNCVEAWKNLAQMWATGDGAPKRDKQIADHFLRMYQQFTSGESSD